MSDWLCAWKSVNPAGVLFVNTLSVRETHGEIEEAPDLGEITDAVNAWLTTKYQAMLRSTYSVTELQVRGILNEYGREHVKSLGSAGTLAAGTGTLPYEICAIMTFKTETATRSGRGRMFIPSPLSSSYLSDQEQWGTGSSYWTAMGQFGDAVVAGHDFNYGTGGLSDGHLEAQVYSRAKLTTYPIKSYIRRQAPHWLRSRSTAP